MVLDLEGRGLGGVEDLDLRGQDLDLAGGEALVGHALGPHADGAGNLDRPLGADRLGAGEGLGTRELGVEGDLGHALAVAQVDEDEAAVIAAVPDPAGEHDLLADVLGAQLCAAMGMHGMGGAHGAGAVLRHGSPSRLRRPVPGQAALTQTVRQA